MLSTTEHKVFLYREIHVSFYFLKQQGDFAVGNYDFTLASLRNCQSNCPALSKKLAENPGQTSEASFPRNPILEWRNRGMKMVRVHLCDGGVPQTRPGFQELAFPLLHSSRGHLLFLWSPSYISQGSLLLTSTKRWLIQLFRETEENTYLVSSTFIMCLFCLGGPMG